MVSRTKRTPKNTQSRRKMGKRVRGGEFTWYNPLTWLLPKPADNTATPKTADNTDTPKPDEAALANKTPATPKPADNTATPKPADNTATPKPATMGGYLHNKKKAKEHSVSVNRKKANSKSRSTRH